MLDRQPPTRPVRVALRIADGPVPAYLAAAVELVLGIEGVELVAILVDDAPARRPTTRKRARAAIEAGYEALERRVLPGGQRALVATPPGLEDRGIPVVRSSGVSGQGGDPWAGAELDVMVDLGPPPRAGSVQPPVPPLGRWRLVFAEGVDGPRRDRLSRPASRIALVVSALEIELPSGARTETGTGVGAVQRAGFARDRDAVLWRASQLPARRLSRLVAGEAVPAPGLDAAAAAAQPSGARRRPGIDVPVLALARRAVAKGLERLVYRSAWCVLVRDRRPGDPPPHDLSGFRRLDAPPGRFYADPFVAEMASGPRILVEDSPLGKHQGRITSLRRGACGSWTSEGTVLEDIAHRAYPHVIETDRGLVVTPDGGRSGGVDIFIEDGPGIPLRQVARCLEGVPASDPTLLYHDGRFWLFAGVTGHGMQPWDELHLWFAASLDGPWHSHLSNPVVADVRRARPAGRIFPQDGGLVRPGQDCSTDYGGRIVLSAITTLTPDAYAERPFASIDPRGAAGVTRTHTYSFGETVETLDGYVRLSRLPRLDASRR